MIQKISRAFLVVVVVSIFTLSATQKSQAEISLFSALKDFFKKSIGIGHLSEKVVVRKNVDWARWNERIENRNFFKQNYLVNDRIIDLLKFDNDANPDAINVSSGDPGLDPTAPDIAYDTVNNRYLVVWEEETDPGVFNILGQFRDRNGMTIGEVVPISTTPDGLNRVNRPTQGCFYANFDSDNGDISTPGLNDCEQARNPSVAYNNGRYLIVWELHGRGQHAHNSDGSNNDAGKDFSNIIAKMVNASNLSPSNAGWNEGILISRTWIASNTSTNAINDSQIQAWGQGTNPDVAPKVGSDGFLVTWQSNGNKIQDFIGCVDPNRRDSTSIYARFVDQNFVPSCTPDQMRPESEGGGCLANKPTMTISTDPSTITNTCPTLDNVMRSQKPRIAFNSNRSDFVITFEFARAASATKGDIGAKRVVLNAMNEATVNNSMVPEVVAAAPEGTIFHNPDVASFGGNVVLAYDDGDNVQVKRLTTASGEAASSGSPTTLSLGGSGARTEPRIGGNIGVGGTRMPAASDPQRVLVSYTQGGALKAVVIDDTQAIRKGPVTVSGSSTANHIAEVGSDLVDFFVVWAGTAGGLEQVWGAKVNADRPPPDCTWNGTNPVTPGNGVTWAPTRLFLDWNACTATVPGDTLVYDVYFALGGSSGVNAYKSGLTTTSFVIQASTDNRPQYNPDGGVPAVFLASSSTYTWKICARNSSSSGPTDGPSCSPDRTFNTDDSVVGWWRFDENAGNGGTFTDSTGHGNSASIFSNDADNTILGADILGQAFVGDGANDYALVSASPSVESINAISFSMEILAKTSSPSTTQMFIWRGDGSGAQSNKFYSLFITANQLIFRHKASGSDLDTRTITGVTPILADTWFHTVTVRNLGVSLQLYRDSVSDAAPVADNVNTFDWTGFTRPLSLGATYEGVSPVQLFNGTVDEILIYSNSLSSGAVRNNYCASNASPCSP